MKKSRTIERCNDECNGRYEPNESILDLNKRTIFFCYKCRMHFIRRPYVIFNTGVDRFCPACNKINGNRKSWVFGYEALSNNFSLFQNKVIFVPEYWREDLPGYKAGNRKLSVDFAIFHINNFQMPIGVFEAKSSEPASQDNGAKYYQDKKRYYESSNIPFFVINYSSQKEVLEVSAIHLEHLLHNIIDFYLNETEKSEKFKKWFPYENILLY